MHEHNFEEVKRTNYGMSFQGGISIGGGGGGCLPDITDEHAVQI